jgi:hypothetical protein
MLFVSEGKFKETKTLFSVKFNLRYFSLTKSNQPACPKPFSGRQEVKALEER